MTHENGSSIFLFLRPITSVVIVWLGYLTKNLLHEKDFRLKEII